MQQINRDKGDKMEKFWNFTEDENGGRVLELNGTICEDGWTWFDDDVSPQMFKDELESVVGDITVQINSPGGDVFAAAQMYNILKAHRGKVTVFIDSLAASAASVVAMAGDVVEMSPVGMLMIHNPSTMAFGDHNEMEKTIEVLTAVKESIINAYQAKTGLSRQELSDLMEQETWMSAHTALEKGFVDKIRGEETAKPSVLFAAKSADRTLLNKIVAKFEGEIPEKDEPETVETQTTVTDNGTPVTEIYARLNAIKSMM